jgi:hypothetical protein
MPSLDKIMPASQDNSQRLEALIQVPEMPSASIRTHNETLPVAAVCVCNPDRSPARIYRCDTTPTSTGFAEIVSDDFSILHAGGFSSFALRTAAPRWYEQDAMTRAMFTAAIALLCSMAGAIPPRVTVVSPCECRDAHGKGR